MRLSQDRYLRHITDLCHNKTIISKTDAINLIKLYVNYLYGWHSLGLKTRELFPWVFIYSVPFSDHSPPSAVQLHLIRGLKVYIETAESTMCKQRACIIFFLNKHPNKAMGKQKKWQIILAGNFSFGKHYGFYRQCC